MALVPMDSFLAYGRPVSEDTFLHLFAGGDEMGEEREERQLRRRQRIEQTFDEWLNTVRDAERYRWLKKTHLDNLLREGGSGREGLPLHNYPYAIKGDSRLWTASREARTEEEVDAAIDREMNREMSNK